jgi:hypothetical protein
VDQERKREYKTFYGSASSNSCAYCFKHHKALTPRQLKKRECLKRQCDALQRCEHPLWEQREKKKEQRIARRERLEKMYEEVTANGVRT